MDKMNDKLVKSCNDAVTVLKKLNLDEYKELNSKLDWCIGSYEHDNNPAGLIETGSMALNVLKKFKTKNPRKVNKKVIENLEKVIYSSSNN